MPSNKHDRLRTALEEIERAAARNVERSEEIRRRVRWFLEQLDDDSSLEALVSAETSPRVVELITLNMTTLENVGSELRASMALALREEGLTIESIAALFGVTRQRISALLRQKAAMESDRTGR
jgi:transcriptional regulator